MSCSHDGSQKMLQVLPRGAYSVWERPEYCRSGLGDFPAGIPVVGRPLWDIVHIPMGENRDFERAGPETLI